MEPHTSATSMVKLGSDGHYSGPKEGVSKPSPSACHPLSTRSLDSSRCRIANKNIKRM